MFSKPIILLIIISIGYLPNIQSINLLESRNGDQKPIFGHIPPAKLYVTQSDPVTIYCAAFRCNSLHINCFNDKDTVSKTTTKGMLDKSRDTFFIKDKKKLTPQQIMTHKQMDRISKSVNGQQHQVNLTLTEKTVESWFVNSFWCQCEAVYFRVINNGSEVESLISSPKTYIELAYIEKTFKQEPNSASLYLERYVKLTCIPPEGNPKPQIYWRKNGERLILQDSTKVHVSDDGSLVIYSTAASDNGLYECVATNKAGTRVSKAARLEVLETDQQGDWLPWAPWNACPSECNYGTYCASKCRKYLRRRSRLCRDSISSSSRNTGKVNSDLNRSVRHSKRDQILAKCPGESLQTESCAKFCKVDGGWGKWSEWTLCQPDCTRRRIRECNQPEPQGGGLSCIPPSGFTVKQNCSSHLCLNIDARNSESSDSFAVRDMVVYIVLSVALFLLIFVTLLVFCLQRRNILFSSNADSIDGKLLPDKNGFIMLKSIGDQNGLVKDSNSESAVTYNSSSAQNPSPSNPLLIKEHTSSLPSSGSLNSSANKQLLPPIPSVNQMLPSSPQPFQSTSPNATSSSLSSSPLSKQVSFQQSSISCHYKDVPIISYPALAKDYSTPIMANSSIPMVGYSPLTGKPISTPFFLNTSEDHNTMMTNSKYVSSKPSQITVSNKGGKVILGSTGVSVTVLPDSFSEDDEYPIELYTRNSHEQLAEYEEFTQLSSMIFCNICESAKLKKPIILSFPHCIDYSTFDYWNIKLMSMNLGFQWEQLMTVTSISQTLHPSSAVQNQPYCHVTETTCTLMLYKIQPLVLIGHQFSPTNISLPPVISSVLDNNNNNSTINHCNGLTASKRICLVTFLEPFTISNRNLLNQLTIQISCYFFIDTKDIRENLIARTTSAGCRIFDIPKTLVLRNINENVTMTIECLATNSASWKIHPISKYQEITTPELWNIRSEPFFIKHISLEQQDPNIFPFQGNLIVYQNSYFHERLENIITLNSEMLSNSNPVNNSSINYQIQQYSNCKFISPSKTFRLPRATVRELANHLDPPKISTAQWKMVAKQLGISYNLDYFLNQSSPTTYLLMLWEAENREETALVDLQSTLRVMGLIEISNTLNK